MKKKILGFATLALALISLPAAAQGKGAKDRSKNRCVNTECTNQACPASDSTCARARCGAFNPFDGIQLTDAQRAGLKVVNEKRMAQRRACVEQQKCERISRDSLRMKARFNSRRNYLNDVKQVLTPDQYVVFLENMVVNTPDKNGKPGKHGKFGKDKKKYGRDAGQRDNKARKDKQNKKN